MKVPFYFRTIFGILFTTGSIFAANAGLIAGATPNGGLIAGAPFFDDLHTI